MVEAVDGREKPGLVRPGEPLIGEKYSPKVSPCSSLSSSWQRQGPAALLPRAGFLIGVYRLVAEAMQQEACLG